MNRKYLFLIIGLALVAIAAGLTLAFTIFRQPPHTDSMAKSATYVKSSGPTRTFTNPGGCCNKAASGAN